MQQYNNVQFGLLLLLVLVVFINSEQICPEFPIHTVLTVDDHRRLITTPNLSSNGLCYTIGQCRLTFNRDHIIILTRPDGYSQSLLFLASSNNNSIVNRLINHSSHSTLTLSLVSTSGTVNSSTISTKKCYAVRRRYRAVTPPSTHRTGDSSTSIVITFNSTSFIDYHHRQILDYPFRLSLRFRTLGRISNGVLLSLIHRKSSTLNTPFIIIEHSNGKVEVTILQLDDRKILSTVTTVQCGKNVNNDNWHWLQFEIDQQGVFTLVVDDDSRTSQIPSYVVSRWDINALLVADTRRLSADIFQPFIGYMSDLVFNDEHLFTSLTTRKGQTPSTFHHHTHHISIGYRVAFFNLVTIDTQTSYIAFSERESQNKNHGKLDIYFLFRSLVPDGIILYRYAQGLNEYFAIGLRAGILALFIDFGFGKRQVVSDESTKLADGRWHEVRVTRIGMDKIELVVDNRVNLSTLSANGIRNAVSLQPVLYVGGIPNSNNINLTGSGLNSHGFQGCLSSFIVDGRLLDYQRALVLNGKVKMNVCSDLNKLCYDFTCIHSGVCTTNENNNAPNCECVETGYIGERCDKLPKGFYFGKHHAIGSLEYVLAQSRHTEYDTIVFGLQTLAMSAQIFRLESDSNVYSLEYEIVRGRSYIKLSMGEKQPDVYSAVTLITDGIYHAIKVIRRLSTIELFVDGTRIKLEGGTKQPRSNEQRSFLAQRRLRIGNFKNLTQWNGIIAGLAFNRQSIFDSLSNILLRSGDVEEVYPNEQTGQFHLIDSFYIATPLATSSSSTILSTNSTSQSSSLLSSSSLSITMQSTVVPKVDNLYHQEKVTRINIVTPTQIRNRSIPVQWFYTQIMRLGTRGLIIGSIVISFLLLLLLIIIIRLHCMNRHVSKPKQHHPQANGKNYSQLSSQYQPPKRRSIAPPTGRDSKKRVPNFLRYLHTNEAKPPKPSSLRQTSNGSASRLNSTDSFRLMASFQNLPLTAAGVNRTSLVPFRNSDCLLNEHCCIHSTHSQPVPPPSTSSLYHQVSRLMLSGSEPPLPLATVAACHPSLSATLRSLKKDVDNSSAQTYSAVYSCDLAANLDFDQDFLQQQQHQRSSVKRRSILKNPHSPQNKLAFLYVKNLVDCYALQPIVGVHVAPILLATADDNRIQLSHAHSDNFHSQLPISSVGACHTISFSYNGQFIIGLFYEVTSNVNPYAVKVWSTDDYALRMNLHPIKCSIALTSRHSSVLYMAGKQKYGRGISLGLLDLDSCSLARELKSDPDTSIGDEIRRIILTKNESFALVACTEHTSTFTCFVVFKLDTMTTIESEQQSSPTIGSMSNCTMILTRFDCDPNFTFSIRDSNNNGDQHMLTVLRSNEIIVWQLNDGEIFFSYEFDKEQFEQETKQHIIDCQMNENRLLILFEQGLIYIWDITVIMGQFTLLASIRDPLIHAVSWLDQRQFLSIDHDGQRIRIWNIHRKEVMSELLSLHGTLQSLHAHSIDNSNNSRRQHLIIGMSMNERSLLMFEHSQSLDDPIDASDISVC